jgi:hypothetical protein
MYAGRLITGLGAGSATVVIPLVRHHKKACTIHSYTFLLITSL